MRTGRRRPRPPVTTHPPLLGEGSSLTTEKDSTSLYLRATALVLLGMTAGGALQWIPADPSPWRWLPFGIAYVAGGWPILRDALESLRWGRLSIDLLMGLAALGAAAVGEPLEGTILLFLFSLSNTLEGYAMERTRRAISSLIELYPEEATLVDDQGHETGRVPTDSLTPGLRFLVRPGERIAADGRIVQGRSDIDQSAITGESLPVTRTIGAEIFAGTINGGGSLIAEVTRPSNDTMLARIIRLVEEAREDRAPAQEFIDRFAHPYTLAVLIGSAAVALLGGTVFGLPWGDAFYRSMTILVVGSPCALVISTPAAVLSAIANGARNGILFKGGAVLDRAGEIDAIAFDKTGTLTVGAPRVLAIKSTPAAGGEDVLLRIASGLEALAEHHVARAVVEAAVERGIEPPGVADFRAIPGEGVEGRVLPTAMEPAEANNEAGGRFALEEEPRLFEELRLSAVGASDAGAAGRGVGSMADEEGPLNGELAWVGNEVMASRHGAVPSSEMASWIAGERGLGRSTVLVGHGSEVLGALSFGDRLRPGAAETIHRVKRELGIRKVTILSGDHPGAVAAIARELGADEVRAGLLPDQKVAALREMTGGALKVAMVGDGVNDAPAMAAASVGIAMGAVGTDVAIETADIVLMSDEIPKIEHLLRLARRSRRIVRENVFFSVGWMGLLVVAALTVGLPLTFAVVAHEGSTLLVVLNGLRLLRGQ